MSQTNMMKEHENATVLDAFNTVLGIEGRPFGQTNKPVFGLSDNKKGVQWNIAIFADTSFMRIGVNLEGMKYRDWPIATFILNELAEPSLNDLKRQLGPDKEIRIRFTRDAWQLASRPTIEEQLIGGKAFTLDSVDGNTWQAMLEEAKGCLDETKGYRGRAKQHVTVLKKDGSANLKEMEVSPHLTIWTPLTYGTNMQTKIQECMEELQPVHDWMTACSKA
ncbi:hypothetical protein [Enterovibrio baiacu]|uniref:hypothetical protein n=2 Tax=Enterovibrio baiacu TaxID=2491023 RepID=UPI001012AEF6|nr:hypothetical protein [Enterovibrio baiacu]MBE1275011.1 hypothetical protein [Enterovibrio baiacu]